MTKPAAWTQPRTFAETAPTGSTSAEIRHAFEILDMVEEKKD